jgi:ubiquinone/menaquinone biosynthesis C-methylase UbiE
MLEPPREDPAAAGLANGATVVADAAELELAPQSFDAAVSHDCLQFVPRIEGALRRVRRALEPARGWPRSWSRPRSATIARGACS